MGGGGEESVYNMLDCLRGHPTPREPPIRATPNWEERRGRDVLFRDNHQRRSGNYCCMINNKYVSTSRLPRPHGPSAFEFSGKPSRRPQVSPRGIQPPSAPEVEWWSKRTRQGAGSGLMGYSIYLYMYLLLYIYVIYTWYIYLFYHGW